MTARIKRIHNGWIVNYDSYTLSLSQGPVLSGSYEIAYTYDVDAEKAATWEKVALALAQYFHA